MLKPLSHWLALSMPMCSRNSTLLARVPDAAKARALYAKAAGQGSLEAKQRLDESNR